MMNSCNFVGNLANEPLFFEGDIPRVVFKLAIDHNGKPSDGKKRVEFLDFVAWHQTAEFIHKYCHKGDMLSVQNAMAKGRSIVGKDGTEYTKTEFQVDAVELCKRARSNWTD